MINQFSILTRAVVFGLLTLCFASHSIATTINFDPTTTTKSVGDTFSVNVSGETLTDLYAYQFSVVYDPTVLQAIDITEGAFLSTAGTTFFIPGTIDNVAGLINFTGNTLIGAISGASGLGILASIDFKASADGLSGLSLQDVLFLDSNFNEITISASEGSVFVVKSDGNVPEPPLLSLLFAGSAVLTFMKQNMPVRRRYY
jgi:Cohesin domain